MSVCVCTFVNEVFHCISWMKAIGAGQNIRHVQLYSSKTNDDVSHQQLKDDALLRPRIKQNSKSPDPINELLATAKAFP